MKIAPGVEMLEIETTVMGRPNTIYPVLLQDGRDTVLVDTGYPGPASLSKITSALAGCNLSLQDLTRVILTHQDLDHIGGLPAIVQANPAIETMCHVSEQPYIEGKEKLIKLHKHTTDIAQDMPEPVKKALLHVFEHPPAALICTALKDGDVLPFLGGVAVIHTPGHTPGHICLYVRVTKTLIAGDALTAKDGKLWPPVKEHAQDYDEAINSLARLTALDIADILCYHGGLVRSAKIDF